MLRPLFPLVLAGRAPVRRRAGLLLDDSFTFPNFRLESVDIGE